jgi:hypothetical protein
VYYHVLCDVFFRPKGIIFIFVICYCYEIEDNFSYKWYSQNSILDLKECEFKFDRVIDSNNANCTLKKIGACNLYGSCKFEWSYEIRNILGCIIGVLYMKLFLVT